MRKYLVGIVVVLALLLGGSVAQAQGKDKGKSVEAKRKVKYREKTTDTCDTCLAMLVRALDPGEEITVSNPAPKPDPKKK